jgi:hypothetical protein
MNVALSSSGDASTNQSQHVSGEELAQPNFLGNTYN